ncbi:MAG: hypothetical protein HC866_02305 [Leptolyngbyaceae cyanobacterium RU_5_1]|nr:hypothetical protein [Leptolyngbyaceae cyanobacterium RU_5_1]
MTQKTLLASVQCSAQITLGVLLAIGVLASGVVPSAHAQTGTPQPLEDLRTKDAGSDLFSGQGLGPQSGLMNLIHRAIQGGSRSPDEVTSEQKESLDEATARFRANQAERLRLQRQQTPLEVTPNPVTSTPSN